MNIAPEEDLQPQDDSADSVLGFVVALVAALVGIVALASGIVAL